MQPAQFDHEKVRYIHPSICKQRLMHLSLCLQISAIGYNVLNIPSQVMMSGIELARGAGIKTSWALCTGNPPLEVSYHAHVTTRVMCDVHYHIQYQTMLQITKETLSTECRAHREMCTVGTSQTIAQLMHLTCSQTEIRAGGLNVFFL